MFARHYWIITGLALLSAILGETEARAGYTNKFSAKLTGTYGSSLTFKIHYQEVKNNRPQDTVVSAKAVRFSWKVTSGEGPQGAMVTTFDSFCIDLMQAVGSGEFTINDSLVNALNPSYGNLIDSTKAAMIEAYWKQNIDSANKSANNASAFQIGLWELVYEKKSNLDAKKLDVKSGVFYIENPKKGNNNYNAINAILNQANDYLSFLKDTDYSKLPEPTLLVALTTSKGQDQITPGIDCPPPVTPTGHAVPTPPAFLLAILGFMGLIAGRLRLSRQLV